MIPYCWPKNRTTHKPTFVSVACQTDAPTLPQEAVLIIKSLEALLTSSQPVAQPRIKPPSKSTVSPLPFMHELKCKLRAMSQTPSSER